MIYLSDLYDPQHRLLPEEPLARSKVIQFLMFQMGGVGPMQVCICNFGHHPIHRQTLTRSKQSGIGSGKSLPFVRTRKNLIRSKEIPRGD